MALRVEDFINFFYLVYSSVRSLIQSLFSSTIATASPELADKFADATTVLISVTAIWLIFEFATGFRKIFRIIILLGWLLLIVSIIAGISLG